LIETLSEKTPFLKKTWGDMQLIDSRSNSLVLINGREISVLSGLETKLSDGDEVVFIPVVHGG
jgi:molybdopterin converting factor small subunit